MNSFAISFVVISAACLLGLPRRWAVLPLLTGACFITIGQVLDLGPFSFTVTRILVAVGLMRVVVRRERLPGGVISIDRLLILWTISLCCSSVFHDDPRSDLIGKLGQTYEACGVYFLSRIFLVTLADLVRLGRVLAIVLLPVAAGMLFEHVSTHNLFSIFGGVPEVAMVRNGQIRATGPFMHPILAGTIGATTLPLTLGLWRFNRATACIGSLVCLTITVASSSSGPLMSAMAAIVALLSWPLRKQMRGVRIAAVVVYIFLDLVMKAPAYYIIARIDLTGSSTGWHRAELIRSALDHLDEWYLAGTDYTRHWMPTGVSWNANHTDITNHYLQMGVMGGLPSMLLFIGAIVIGFSGIGKRWRQEVTHKGAFVIWALGACLFSHATTFISVSYFDQSVVFFYLVLAAIGSVSSARSVASSQSWIMLRQKSETPSGTAQATA